MRRMPPSLRHAPLNLGMLGGDHQPCTLLGLMLPPPPPLPQAGIDYQYEPLAAQVPKKAKKTVFED